MVSDIYLKFDYVVTLPRSGEPKNGGSIVNGSKIFSILQNIEKCSGAHQASSKLGTEGCYRRNKAKGGEEMSAQLHGMSRLR
jgi:hypothetical protein